MRAIFVGIALSLAAVVAAAAPPTATLTIEATPMQARLHRGERVDLDIRVTNTTGARVSYMLMSCSWPDAWQSDDPELALDLIACDKNVPRTTTLDPGQVDSRRLRLAVSGSARLGAHTLRVAFSVPGASKPIWSAPLTVQLVAVAGDVAVTAKKLEPREIAFAVRNTIRKPIAIADHVVLQHEIDDTWVDMTSMSATSCAATTACTTIERGKSVAPAEWLGMTCAQCACRANTFAEAGDYRLRVEACDGQTDYLGAPVALPAR